MTTVTGGAGNRASVVRQHDAARQWHRRRRARTVVFLDPELDAGCSLLSQLRSMGIEASVHTDAFRAVLEVGEHQPDALVLSAQTPVGDAVRTVSILRAEFALPILLAMAPEETETAAPLIVAGARPLLERPYRFESVLAALGEVNPRYSNVEPVHIGALVLDPAGLAAKFNGRHLDLSPKEFAVLWALAEHADQVVGQEELLRAVWPGRDVSAATLATVVGRVRHRLIGAGVDGAIHTIRRLGYRLEAASFTVLGRSPQRVPGPGR